jgi:hypothetical protein
VERTRYELLRLRDHYKIDLVRVVIGQHLLKEELKKSYVK